MRLPPFKSRDTAGIVPLHDMGHVSGQMCEHLRQEARVEAEVREIPQVPPLEGQGRIVILPPTAEGLAGGERVLNCCAFSRTFIGTAQQLVRL